MTLKNALTLAVSALALLSSPIRLAAQGVSNAMLLHPPADTWPTYHGDYSGKRHSPLTQINPQNVGQLSLAWALPNNQSAEMKSSPLLVNGVLYFTAPDNVWAVDARSGHQLWHYTYPVIKGFTSVSAAWPCTANGCTLSRPMPTCSASTPKTEPCAGTSWLPIPAKATGRPYRR